MLEGQMGFKIYGVLGIVHVYPMSFLVVIVDQRIAATLNDVGNEDHVSSE